MPRTVVLAILATWTLFGAPAAPGQQPPPTPPVEAESTPGDEGSSDIGQLPAVASRPAVRPGAKAPVEFSSIGLDGKTVIFPNDFRGKLVLVHVWATWCPHCMEEIQYWRRAESKLGLGAFAAVGIVTDANRGGTPKQVKEFLFDKRIGWTNIYQDAPRIAAMLGAKSVPSVYLFDGDTGELLFKDRELRGKKLMPLLKPLVAAKKAATSQPAAPANPAASQPTGGGAEKPTAKP